MFGSGKRRSKLSIDSDQKEGKPTVEEYEVSQQLSDEPFKGSESTKSSSMWKSADAHRGEPKLEPASDDMMRFTATGRPFKAEDHYQSTWANLSDGDNPHGVAGRTLPWKYTDESLISVPCLRLVPGGPQQSISPTAGPNDKKKKWWRRKWSTSNSGVNNPENFVMKQMQRGEYLKHYAKDEQGNFAGTEEPADNCILRGKDLEKYGRSNDMDFQSDTVDDPWIF
jgi:hypothetical protein